MKDKSIYFNEDGSKRVPKLKEMYPGNMPDSYEPKESDCPACGSGARPSVQPADHSKVGRRYRSCPDCGIRRPGKGRNYQSLY